MDIGRMYKMNKYNWVPPCDADLLRKMYEDKMMTQTEIAITLGLTVKRVQTAMKRFGIKSRKATRRNQWGKNNPNWKASNAKYAALHLRVNSLRGQPKKCEECGETDPKKRYEWASMSGRYEDPNDYRRLCCSCHKKLDNVIRNLRNAGY